MYFRVTFTRDWVAMGSGGVSHLLTGAILGATAGALVCYITVNGTWARDYALKHVELQRDRVQLQAFEAINSQQHSQLQELQYRLSATPKFCEIPHTKLTQPQEEYVAPWDHFPTIEQYKHPKAIPVDMFSEEECNMIVQVPA